jgi:hypothetical protein
MQSAEGSLLAMIVDQDTATGLLLTGVGQVDLRKRSNFLIVDDSEWRCRRLGSQRVGCGRQHEAGRVPPPRRVAGGQASRLWQRGTEGWSQAASLPASQLHHIHHLCIRQLTITTHASPPPPLPLPRPQRRRSSGLRRPSASLPTARMWRCCSSTRSSQA